MDESSFLKLNAWTCTINYSAGFSKNHEPTCLTICSKPMVCNISQCNLKSTHQSRTQNRLVNHSSIWTAGTCGTRASISSSCQGNTESGLHNFLEVRACRIHTAIIKSPTRPHGWATHTCISCKGSNASSCAFWSKTGPLMLFFVKKHIISLYFVMICMFLVEGKNLSTVSTSSSCSLWQTFMSVRSIETTMWLFDFIRVGNVRDSCSQTQSAKTLMSKTKQEPASPSLPLPLLASKSTNCIIIHTKLHCKHNLANKSWSMIRVVSPHVQEADLSFLRTVHPVWLYGSSEAIDSKRSVHNKTWVHLKQLRSEDHQAPAAPAILAALGEGDRARCLITTSTPSLVLLHLDRNSASGCRMRTRTKSGSPVNALLQCFNAQSLRFDNDRQNPLCQTTSRLSSSLNGSISSMLRSLRRS